MGYQPTMGGELGGKICLFCLHPEFIVGQVHGSIMQTLQVFQVEEFRTLSEQDLATNIKREATEAVLKKPELGG